MYTATAMIIMIKKKMDLSVKINRRDDARCNMATKRKTIWSYRVRNRVFFFFLRSRFFFLLLRGLVLYGIYYYYIHIAHDVFGREYIFYYIGKKKKNEFFHHISVQRTRLYIRAILPHVIPTADRCSIIVSRNRSRCRKHYKYRNRQLYSSVWLSYFIQLYETAAAVQSS